LEAFFVCLFFLSVEWLCLVPSSFPYLSNSPLAAADAFLASWYWRGGGVRGGGGAMVEEGEER
jgi:hypothetical protein